MRLPLAKSDNALVRLTDLSAARHEEYVRNFASLTARLSEVQSDVKSLLDTRTFTNGMIRAIVLVSGIVSAMVSMAILYVRHRP